MRHDPPSAQLKTWEARQLLAFRLVFEGEKWATLMLELLLVADFTVICKVLHVSPQLAPIGCTQLVPEEVSGGTRLVIKDSEFDAAPESIPDKREFAMSSHEV
ncbi:MAG TPA: hypothetical protein VMV10_21620 [Pirellulales bacterium]|nr:hypothetical protein [Pirellulales bacterium]